MAYHLEAYITEAHFRRMGYLLLALALIYGYFTFGEYLTPAYKMPTPERGYLTAVFSGQFAPLFSFTQIGGVLLPVLLLTLPRIAWVPRLRAVRLLQVRPALTAAATYAVATIVLSVIGSRTTAAGGVDVFRIFPAWVFAALGVWLLLALLPVFHDRPVAAAVTASVLVNIGAWLKRYVIIVPTLQNPFLPIQGAPAGWAIYQPTWVEWSITAVEPRVRPGREVLSALSPQPGFISPYLVPTQVMLLALVLGGIWTTYGYVAWLLSRIRSGR